MRLPLHDPGHDVPQNDPVRSPLCLFFSALSAAGDAQSLAVQSTPTLNVFVYGFAGFSPWVLHGAETEAARMLRPAQIKLKWIDCISQVLSESCRSPKAPKDLIIRVLPKALPQAGTKALGIACSSPDCASAFLFYDRILALRSHRRLLPAMLGRAVAHEITHVLLPRQGHSPLGLMRAEWSMDDLDLTGTSCLGLSSQSVQFLYKEALRRLYAKESVLETDDADGPEEMGQTSIGHILTTASSQ